ncbi:MAG: SDR family NAD(P)-dependent oxidoreductase [Myxococcales bacterium]|nr:SDR family NAD(P)-dependent oxidoreductase [Myxococcales bacterium]
MTARWKLPARPRAVVTGAASGLGRALALRLAERRARLVLGDIDEEGLDRTAAAVREAGGQVRTLRCDVREAAQVEALARTADEEFGATDLLVNNAGVAVVGPVGEVSLEDWRWQVDINLWGVVHGCHAFVPGMKARRAGHILNVASSAGLVCAPMMAPYNVTKAGVIALSETLYGELRGEGIGVSVLCPTFLRTNIHASSRYSNAELRDLTGRLVSGATWTAEQVADHTLACMERGDLFIIPQRDGRALWWGRRVLGAEFQRWMGGLARSPRLLRWISERVGTGAG